ncbi:response regulator [Mucilaginibacter ximonensis]|uniref:Response regulator n=1 Tax=Mucilaginibacter ximonensis TaxID=538021 RepID=A0ABW5YAC8_9SPHI
MIRVLIADSDKNSLDGITNLLANEPEINVIGYAQDGEALLNLVRAGKIPDVVLTDVHLPNMNGILLAQHFSRHFPFIKTIVFTLEDQECYMADAFKSGIKSYINKSISREELLFAIRQVYHGKNYICTHLAAKLAQLFIKGQDTPGLYAEPMIDFSPRELEVLQLIADGATNQEIADQLFTSRRTVEGHRQAMINKTGVRNTPALVKYAMRYQLLKSTPPKTDIEKQKHHNHTVNL